MRIKNLILFLFFILYRNVIPQSFSWAKSFEGGSYDYPNNIAEDMYGNIYQTSFFSDSADVDPGPGVKKMLGSVVCKLSSGGDFIWAVQIGANSGSKIHLRGPFLYLTGSYGGAPDFDPGPSTYTMSAGSGSKIFILKLDTSAFFYWAKSVGGNSYQDSKAIIVDSFGSVYITGEFWGTSDFDPGSGTFSLTTSSAATDIFLLKLDSVGNFEYARQTGGNFQDAGLSLHLDTKRNIYMTGSFSSVSDFDPGPGTFTLSAGSGRDVFITKLDSAGSFLWAKQIGSAGYDCRGNDIECNANNDVYVTGVFEGITDFDPGPATYTLNSASGFANTPDIFILKLDSSGNFIYAKTIGGPDYDESASACIDKFGSYYITGRFQDIVDFDPGPGSYTINASTLSFYTLKLNASGDFEWLYVLSNNSGVYGSGVLVNNKGDVSMTGAFVDMIDFDPGPGTYNLTSLAQGDVFVVKLFQNAYGIKEMADNQVFISVYPNPCSDIISVKSEKESLSDVVILNSNGREVLRQENANSVSLSHLSSGSYFIQVKGGQSMYTKKIIVSH